MKIAVLGAGSIGSTLAGAFAAHGHDVALANSRGPETIADLAASLGARATTAEEAVRSVEVVVTSIPLNRLQSLRPVLAAVPADVPVVDTANYYPQRDGRIAALDAGQLEAHWIGEQLGRPVARAWNAVLAGTLAERGVPAGTPGRIAIPVAGDDPDARRIAATLTDITGFDAYDIGGLDNTWRIQPGNPAYCTDLTRDALEAALARGDAAIAPTRRDLVMAVFATWDGNVTGSEILALNRAITRVA
ncbi:NAD(P)-binding domain-containing protein [Patulibacter minatonensis]|uniref:NAD(P)-binding domain-containing protein n=1 Tax=Patulibacter minatonensis TaxID=298163 RepID=UPI00047E042A